MTDKFKKMNLKNEAKKNMKNTRSEIRDGNTGKIKYIKEKYKWKNKKLKEKNKLEYNAIQLNCLQMEFSNH